MQADNRRRRLFFALWPDAAIAVALGRIAQAANKDHAARVLRTETLHLTLAFIGEVDAARVPQLDAVASAVALPAFQFALDRLGCWERQHLLWAGTTATIAELEQLARHLREELHAAGFAAGSGAFTPHVSLVRNFRGATVPAMDHPIAWLATEFVLAESLPAAPGRHYRILTSWPLRQSIR